MGFKDETLYTGSPQPYGEIFVMTYDGTHMMTKRVASPPASVNGHPVPG
jgi:hypothetical protein